MKKIWVYLLGVLTGIITAVVALNISGMALNKSSEIMSVEDSSCAEDADVQNGYATRGVEGMSFFETPGDVIDVQRFKVSRVLGDGIALAWSNTIESLGLEILLYNEDGNLYYDQQKIIAPKGKCFRQIGIYRYSTNTIPIVMIMDK